MSHDRFIKLIISMLICSVFTQVLEAQDRRQMEHEDFAVWNRITDTKVSNDGNWVAWNIQPGEGDPTLHLYHAATNREQSFHRATDAVFTADNRFLLFRIGAPTDTIREMKRNKVKKDELPGDSLGIFTLKNGALTVIPGLQSFKVPGEWSGFVCYQVKMGTAERDSLKKKDGGGDAKKGLPLVIRNLETSAEDTLPFTKSYALAKKADLLALYTTGKDSTFRAGVYRYTCTSRDIAPLTRAEGEYKNLAISEDGSQVSFLGDMDTTKVRVRPYQLFYYASGMDSASVIASSGVPWLADAWHISANISPAFSENGRYLHFGTAAPPVLEDTTLLDEEIVQVEVWHYDDPYLYTQQNVRVEDEKKRTYLAVYDTRSGEFRQVETMEREESSVDRHMNSPYILTYTLQPYHKGSSWTGMRKRDLYLTDLRNGESSLIGKGIAGSARMSPDFQFVYWYNAPDTSWFVHHIEQGKTMEITPLLRGLVHDELNDRPMYPDDYGIAGWLRDDAGVLVCDRYDIWLVDPLKNQAPRNLTNGRADETTYRYVRLDPDETFIDPGQSLLLHTFYHADKSGGYARLDLGTGKISHLVKGQYRYDQRPVKSKHGNTIVYTRQSFREFPDLRLTQNLFRSSMQISKANPQQSAYTWGNIEIFEWEYDGKTRRGLVVKPDGFDPSKKYPMIVNFYERSTDGLHTYRHPQPHRSTINYPFYASRGYVIFNPDVEYTIGYPGESAFNAVVPGTRALIGEGFIDPEKIALQGHSWGGYQVAHIITKTDMFACAESGAPVVNMISAYGGIRWGTGLSRMFQYEKTQSRIGATLWERPDLYIVNSPIFNADKINTPVLILHNDQDGAVPWYQGIEFFVAMRRLGKPAWMLNYNTEPHWPLKLQNRKDFNIRMQQFFDHYLKGEPMPKWMQRGVPATEKGILQGYELVEERE